MFKELRKNKLTRLLGKLYVILTEHAQHVGQENAQVTIHHGLNVPLYKIHKVTSHKPNVSIYIPVTHEFCPFFK